MPAIFSTLLIAVSALSSSVAAVPLNARSSANAAATSVVSQSQFADTFLRPALFSRLAYCSPQAVTNLNCGGPCNEIGGDFKVLQAGGDGTDIPFFYVGHDPSTDSVVVAHQGTDSRSILSIANDAQFVLTDLDKTLFPKAGSGVEVHDGFQKTWGRTANDVLTGVQSALNSTKAKNLLVTGHSLGAAIASMDAVMLKMQLPSSVNIRSAVFGLPRGGNAAWAKLIETTLGDSFAFATNQHDPVPDVPPQFLGYHHSTGEVHIKAVDSAGNATSVVACPGEDNSNCSDGNSLFDSSVSNHKGPYLHNITMSHGACPF